MLRKLLKYEIKSTARTLLPLYLALLVFAGINRLITSISPNEWESPAVISMMLYIIILVGMLVMTLNVMIQRFYKNLLSDEGYLMFTLPTKPWAHIMSKLLVSMIWTLASGLLAVISIFIIAMDEISFSEMIRGFSMIWEDTYALIGASTYLLALEFILGMFVALASGILIIYASIAMGHLSNRHKVMASIGSFLLLNTIAQILTAIFAGIVFTRQFLDFAITSQADLGFVHLFMWSCIIFCGVLAAGYYVITNVILSKRLNLE